MFTYTRRVYYYETDKMGVVHHSNFIRWFEEARVAFLEEIGLPFDAIEAGGVYSPITALRVRFKYFARFGDIFTVHLWVATYTGTRFTVGYSVVNQDGKLLIEAESDHAFINTAFRPVSLAKALPHAHGVLQDAAARYGPPAE